MTIKQIAESLNQIAISENYKISSLPELRKQFLHKKKLPNTIFTWQTINDGKEKYAFHHGGRDEIQFNVGEEDFKGKAITRYGLCFSLEPSPSLHNPVEILQKFREKFNECFLKHPELFKESKMWYYQGGKRSENYDAQIIPNHWFKEGSFLCLGAFIEKPLSEIIEIDLKKILNGFDALFPIYDYCVLNNSQSIKKVKIFTRLTSNENNWELPSPHRWKKENQGKNNIAYENQYGFGHEEWLFNPRYKLNGVQYGYIRGIHDRKEDTFKYDEVHLYTVKKEKSKNFVYYLGYIKDVFVVKNDDIYSDLLTTLIEDFKNEMFKEIENINGDVNGIIKFPFSPSVKFNINDVHFIEEPVYQPDFDLDKFKRFQPYKLSKPIEDIFTNVDDDNHVSFIAGKASQTSVYNRKNKDSSSTITRLHSEIIDALELFLKPKFTLKAKNISIETMRFNGNIADLVTQENDSSISIYEVKTSASGRRNIRDAIAQLLDYALHAGEFKINRLVIVSPSKLVKSDIAFLKALRMKIDFPIEYLYYQNDKIFIQQ